MISSQRLHARFSFRISIAAFVVVALGALFFVSHNVYGQGAGDGTVGACGSVYCTDTGFGWKKYPVSSNGPSGGLTGWSWNTVKSTCKDVESVWLFVVKGVDNPPTWKAFAYKHGNGIQDDLSGAYMSAHYQGDASPTDVKGYYDEAVAQGVSGVNGATITWGDNLEWFCYGQKPWKVTVATSATPGLVEVGQTVTWKHTISVSENTTTADVAWKAVNSGALGTGDVKAWTYTKGKVKPASTTEETTYVVQPNDFGKQLCHYTYATPASNKGGSTQSEPACVTVLKRPKVQVYGNDLYVRGNIGTSMSTIGGKKYGSWGEYAIGATGAIGNMSSGAGYVGGAALSTCALNPLTFANVTAPDTQCNSSTKYGVYGDTSASLVASLGVRFPIDTATPKLAAATNINDLSSGLTYTAGAATITLTSSTQIAKGKWVVINAPAATIRITQNISYTGEPLAVSKDIPQIVIIAKTIIIADNVTKVDAWLIAKDGKGSGVLITCDAAGVEPANLSAAVCNQKLTINGPVATDRLYLYRTYGAGSGPTLTQAAEVFNLRPDAYLWATERNGNSDRIQTMTTQEVPPRF